MLGVGVGTPGVVDGRGVILDAHNLQLGDVDLTGILRRQLDLPVYVANDANTAVLAEYTFGGTTAADLMLLRIGTGVGAGLVVGGALVQGHAWAAGEIGHVVVDPAGVRCACGKTGCLETILSVPHLRHSDRPLASVGTVLGEVLAPVVGRAQPARGRARRTAGPARRRAARGPRPVRTRPGDGRLVGRPGGTHVAAGRRRGARRRRGACAVRRAGGLVSGELRVGLDIGATKVLGVVVDADGTVVAQSRQDTRLGADGVLASATAVLDSLTASLDGALPAHIGVGVCGIVDRDRGAVSHAVNLGIGGDWFPLAARLADRTGATVLIENDVNAATWGAHVLSGADDLAYLSVGTGLAAGFVLSGCCGAVPTARPPRSGTCRWTRTARAARAGSAAAWS